MTALRKKQVSKALGLQSFSGLDTTTKVNRMWWDDFSRYQPDIEVWTQPWKGGWSWWEIKQLMKSGCKRNSGKEAGVYGNEEVAVVFFWAFLARLLGRFGRLIAVIEEKWLSFCRMNSMFSNSILKLWCNAFHWIKSSGIICFVMGKKSFTMLNSWIE